MTYALKPLPYLVVLIDTEQKIELHIQEDKDCFRIIEHKDLDSQYPEIKYDTVSREWLEKFAHHAEQMLRLKKPVIFKTPQGGRYLILNAYGVDLIQILLKKNWHNKRHIRDEQSSDLAYEASEDPIVIFAKSLAETLNSGKEIDAEEFHQLIFILIAANTYKDQPHLFNDWVTFITKEKE